MKKILAYIVFAAVCCVAVAQENFTKAAGDSAYMANNYKEAAQVYEQLLAEGESEALYYNLGNAYYKSNDIAKAILNYERALLLAPADEEIKFNLALARSKTVDKISEPYEMFFTTWGRNFANLMSMDAWSIIAITGFICLLVAVLLFLFSRSVAVKKSMFFVAIIALFVTIFANLSALHHYNFLTNRCAAIIIQPSVTAKSTPDASGTDLFVIHEGRKVNIADDTMKGWKEIELEDGTKGWVPTAALEKI